MSMLGQQVGILEADRSRRLADIKWAAESTDYLLFVDCWHYEGQRACSDKNYRSGTLSGSEVAGWLHEEASFQSLKINGQASSGRLRLLICDRKTDIRMPPKLNISKKTYEQIEKSFRLSPATLPSLYQLPGAHSAYLHYGQADKKLVRLDVVIKVVQKVEIGNHLLSLSHEFSTGLTTAFICGVDALWTRDKYSEYGSNYEYIVSLIEGSISHWSQPLLLPVLLMHNHCERTRLRSLDLENQLVDLEKNLGVTAAGASRGSIEDMSTWPDNVNIKAMTFELNSLSTQIIFVNQVCGWSQGCVTFIADLEKQLRLKNVLAEFSALHEVLDYDLSVISGINGWVETMKARSQAQVNVLFSAVQNELSRRDANSTKKDSRVMITFTFITALFLPGSFAASIFSMSFFNWQASSSQSGPADISEYFWVYWVVAIPLTIATLVGWRLWYQHGNMEGDFQK